MYIKVQKTTSLHGTTTPPSSKSQSIRGLLIALLSKGVSTLINPLDSDDMQDAKMVCQQLGVTLIQDIGSLRINSTGLLLETEVEKINTGNSGITTRFILPLLGLRKNGDSPIYVDCGEQMRKRPIRSLVIALRLLGLAIDYKDIEGQLPVTIQGTLKGGVAEVDGITSQFISALLMALPCAASSSTITVKNLHERPYMEMTLHWLKQQHIQYSHQREDSADIFHIQGNQRYQPLETIIPGDFSSASYLIAAGVLIEGQVELVGLNMQDHQGDKQLVSILQSMGARIAITPKGLRIEGGHPLKGIVIDANDIPDLLPTLAVIGTYAQGKTVIINVPQARIKETDRIHSMTVGLKRLGAKIDEHPDGVTVYQSALQGANVKGYGDHRTVMALAIAGLLAEGETTIDESESINKTFPTFVEIMQALGARIEVLTLATR